MTTESEAFVADPPSYFRPIEERASRRWDQLEGDPELAGPWHQLFKQVQSPRHILSELLQNADDAGASEARVSIENGRFVFEHNGEDFTEAHFASLCRFGYSNKRALHTIGFRGIGFKSTFSLGDRVELFTPTLAVAFQRERFTQPHWIESRPTISQMTRIEVPIANPRLRHEVEKNLEEWLKSPVSLLFFKKIRRVQIGERVMHWQSLGCGPVSDSEWMSLDNNGGDAFLLVRSAEEAFPTDALDEIRKERMLGAEDSGDFPPCRVEIVLGAKGRLYVVLPTGVETLLPFACNAPFIQDPARLKIKDPETSPTNNWLLKRAGKLAAHAMQEWLEQADIPPSDRAVAYGLLPDVDRKASTLEGACAAVVEVAFADIIADQSILLTEEGSLVAAGAAIVTPPEIFDIWPAEQAMALLDEKSRAPLCRQVSAADRAKLIHWKMVEEFTKADLLDRLHENHLPQPSTWRRLLALWVYIAPEVTAWQYHEANQLRIVPVQGKEVLYSALEVVRLGEKKLLQSEDDWEFLAEHLIVLNQNWTRFLAEQRRSDDGATDGRGDASEAAFAVLNEVGLDDTSDVNAVIEQVAADFFGSSDIKLDECVRLAQIAAKLGASIGEAFRFACADRKLRPVSKTVLFDDNGTLEDLLPPSARQTQLLHPSYSAAFRSCTKEDWLQWISSGKAGLKTFPPLIETRTFVGKQRSLEEELKRRGFADRIEPHYKYPWFYIFDWDFEADVWAHWSSLAKDDATIWVAIAEKLLIEKTDFWSQKTSARIVEEATNGNQRTVLRRDLTPMWAFRLRELPCLRDTRGYAQKPVDLLRRTPETEALIDIEPFVEHLLDRETTRPLLDLLGVRRTPSGPGRLLDRLRALAKSDKAPAHEVEKWYRRLDQLLDGAPTADGQSIKEAFRTEKLILAQDGTWVTSGSVFLTGDEEEVPGAAVIRSSVLDLSLWRRIGVAERPSADLALRWLGTLTSGKVLSADDARRARTLLVRYPIQIWQQCGHWVNLLGEWAPTDTLAYALSMQSLFRWSHLHDWVKRKTADLQRLPAETVQALPFSTLSALSDLVEERFSQPTLLTSLESRVDWLTAFGMQLARIELTDPVEAERVRTTAESIAATTWVAAPKLEVIPYLGGVPAGIARPADILWLDGKLFVSPLTKAKLAKRVPEEIGKSLSPDIRAALAYAFERSPEDIRAYLEENFSLGPEQTSAALVIASSQVDELVECEAIDEPSGQPLEVHSSHQSELTTGDLAIVEDEEHVPTPSSELPRQDAEPVQQELAPVSHSRALPKPTRPSVIARFAQTLGFRLDGEDRFYHPDGSWIGRASGVRFPWERRSAGGEVLRRYYPKEHCLEREPLQIEADVWGLLEEKPEVYSFILVNPEGEPVEMTGARLRALCDGGEIKLHPATYRLVMSTGDI